MDQTTTYNPTRLVCSQCRTPVACVEFTPTATTMRPCGHEASLTTDYKEPPDGY